METENFYQCFDCPDGVQIFSTEDELMAHKWDMIRTELSRDHMNCHICSLKHRTFEGLIRHYQLSHPAKQRLACPGCRAVFPRLHLLMQHMEGNDCPYMAASEVGNRRMRKALAAAAAGSDFTSASEVGIFDVGGRVPAAGYGQYLGLDVQPPPPPPPPALGAAAMSAIEGKKKQQPATERGKDSGSGGGGGGGGGGGSAARVAPRQVMPPKNPVTAMASASASAPALRPVPGFNRTAQEFRHGDSKLPDLLTDSPVDLGRQHGLDVWTGQDMLGVEDNDSSLEPGQPPSARQQRQQQQQQQQQTSTGSPGDYQGGPASKGRLQCPPSPSSRAGATGSLDSDHPSHPDFDVFRYKNRITGRFNCPHLSCRRAGKTFKTSGGFITHLRSDTAHTSLRVQCPSCSRYFLTIQALVQHSESQSARCHLRDSEEFHQFLDTLTGGMVAVQGRNIDLTVSYAMQPGATRDFLQGREFGEARGDVI